MKSFVNILVVLFVVLFSASSLVLADVSVPNPSSGGGGGSSSASGLPTDMHVSSEINQHLSLPGFSADLWAGNEDEWLHEFTDYEGNIYSHIHPQQSHGSFNFNLDQGFMGKFFLPTSPRMEINRWDNKGSFLIRATFTFLMTDQLVEWIQPPSINQSWNFGGLNYGTDLSLRHETFWQENGSIETDNIQGSAGFWFENSKVDWANFNVGEYEYWWNDDILQGMQFNVYFDGIYLGDESQLATFNTMISTPEPCTLGLLALGSIMLIRRKRC